MKYKLILWPADVWGTYEDTRRESLFTKEWDFSGSNEEIFS